MNPRTFPDAGPDDPDDAARMAAAASALVDAARAAVPGWIERLVIERATAAGGTVDDAVRRDAVRAAADATAEAVAGLSDLLDRDVDDQTTNPLAVLRRVTVHAHGVLADHRIPPVPRDGFVTEAFPDDVYDLVPATWADVDPALVDPGLTWSAAKAFMFKARRRREGRA